MALSKTTQDHDEIQKWAEARGAKPAEVASTEQGGHAGILRIEFPGAPHANDSALKEISWDEFFEKFDSSGLALIYQDQTADGEQSNFNRLVYPENIKASGSSAKSSGSKASAKKAPAKKSAATKSPSKSTGAKKSTGSSAASKAAPAKSAKKAPAKSAPAKSTPAKKAPAKKAPAKKAPAKKTPAKKSSSKR